MTNFNIKVTLQKNTEFCDGNMMVFLTVHEASKKSALQIFDAFVSTVIFMDNKSFFPRLLLWGNKFRAQNNNAILCF